MNPIAGDKRKRIPGVILFPSLEGQMVPVSTLRLVALPTSTVCIYVYIYKASLPAPAAIPICQTDERNERNENGSVPSRSTSIYYSSHRTETTPGPGAVVWTRRDTFLSHCAAAGWLASWLACSNWPRAEVEKCMINLINIHLSAAPEETSAGTNGEHPERMWNSADVHVCVSVFNVCLYVYVFDGNIRWRSMSDLLLYVCVCVCVWQPNRPGPRFPRRAMGAGKITSVASAASGDPVSPPLGKDRDRGNVLRWSQ